MKAYEHYELAEKLLARASETPEPGRESLLREALVHAVLGIDYLTIVQSDDL